MAKGSWSVLRQDKELMALPVIGALVMALTAIALFIPLATLLNALDTTSDVGAPTEPNTGGTFAFFALVLLGYYLLVLIGQVFAGAVVHGAYTRMTGGDPTIASSIRAAGSRILQLAPWAFATGTVGLIIDALRDRGFIGKIIASIISFAWRTATFLVLPILVIEGLGPRAAYQRSRQLMTRRWGDSAAATFGFMLIGFIASLPAFALIALGASMEIGGAVFIGIAVIWLIATNVVISTLNGVMRAALYLYTVNNQVPADFRDAGLEYSFR
jgi:hypothetical protein